MTWVFVDALVAGTFVVVMLLAAATGQDRVFRSHLRLGAWHHAYAGVVLELLSFLLPAGVVATLLRGFARALLYDDTVQHAVQFITGRLQWRSPLHRLYAHATKRWAWLRQVEAWLDRRLGTSY